VLVLLSACGGDTAVRAAPDAASAPPDAGLPALEIGLPYSVEAGKETYVCLRRHVSDDLDVTAIEPWASPGMHHNTILLDDGTMPDGLSVCDPFVLGHQILFSAGVGTPRLTLPPGVALHVPAGSQLMLQVHVVNASDALLAGTAGERLFTVPAASVAHEADLLYAGPTDFSVAPGRSMMTGRCTLRADATLVAIGPHMHALGVHEKVVLEDDDVLLDEDFDPDRQEWHLVRAELEAGDVIHVTCTYDNGTGKAVPYGPSADDEMCYARLMFYPPLPGSSYCTR
jgi:copper type II ascorbate-dependent monooxygenase-like protein